MANSEVSVKLINIEEIINHIIERIQYGNDNKVEFADVIIVPEFNDEKKVFVFPTGTAEIFHLLKLSKPDLNTIILEDKKYIELALHSNTFRIPKMIVGYAILPLIINFLSSYIYDKYKESSQEPKMELNLIVKRSDGSSIELRYSGPASDASKSIIESVEKASISIMSNGSSQKTEKKSRTEK